MPCCQLFAAGSDTYTSYGYCETITPDSGYQMAEGSLTYSLAVAGGETVKITGNRFTMPAGNVTITCKWETATTTAKGITSFSINHDILLPGLYVSRVDGDVTTYDMRTRRPNTGDLMDNSTMHSLEHMFATYIRNGDLKDSIVYFGPMGCQTGFYLLVRNADNAEVLRQVRLTLMKILAHEGPVFGASSRECGNYRSLSLASAKTEAQRYLSELDAHPVTFKYEE